MLKQIVRLSMHMGMGAPCFPCVLQGQNIGNYYSYRAFGGKNKTVYSMAIILLLPDLNSARR